MKHTFIEGQAYKLRTVGKAQRQTMYFIKIADKWGEDESGVIVITHQAYEFSKFPNGTGNTAWYTDEHIIDFEIAKPAAPKARKTKPCNRCGGTGVLEHMRHVRNGECFNCGGQGKVYA